MRSLMFISVVLAFMPALYAQVKQCESEDCCMQCCALAAELVTDLDIQRCDTGCEGVCDVFQGITDVACDLGVSFRSSIITSFSFNDVVLCCGVNSTGNGTVFNDEGECETTATPTSAPTWNPTWNPTESPTSSPIENPTTSPSTSPTISPTNSPTKSPTSSPTLSPSASPTLSPTTSPTKNPTNSPTQSPTGSPTITLAPTNSPSSSPSNSPSSSPSSSPTEAAPASPVGGVIGGIGALVVIAGGFFVYMKRQTGDYTDSEDKGKMAPVDFELGQSENREKSVKIPPINADDNEATPPPKTSFDLRAEDDAILSQFMGPGKDSTPTHASTVNPAHDPLAVLASSNHKKKKPKRKQAPRPPRPSKAVRPPKPAKAVSLAAPVNTPQAIGGNSRLSNKISPLYLESVDKNPLRESIFRPSADYLDKMKEKEAKKTMEKKKKEVKKDEVVDIDDDL